MSFKDDAIAALDAGREADLGADNPYRGQSEALAKLWMRGYELMLAERFNQTPQRAAYLKARTT